MAWATFVRWMQPRDYGTAAHVLSVLYLVAGFVTVMGSYLGWVDGHLPGSEAVSAAAVGLGVMVLGVLTRIPHSGHEPAWAVAPFAAVALIVAVDLLTTDASLSAQVFFFFPAIYAASQLHVQGAAMVTGAAIAGEIAVVFLQLDPIEAATSAGYMTAIIATVSALLVQSGSAQQRLVAQLERQAAVDSLTGLVTRRVLDDAARAALSGAASGEGTALIMLDLDDFKLINDQHGHPGGDGVLIQLSALLTAGSRRTDIVSRLGGDEIALLLPGCAQTAARSRAEGILAQVRAHRFVSPDGTPIAVSVSMGMAHAPTHAMDLRALYAAADAALYASKRAGRNQLQVAPGPAAGRRHTD